MAERGTCKCCGQLLPLPDALTPDGRSRASRVYDIVRRAGKSGIMTGDLADRLYADDPNGGPDTAAKCVHTYVCKINRMLKPKGQRIVCYGWGGRRGADGFYRLVEIDQ